MKENKSNWRHSVSISKLPKMLLVGILLTVSSISFAQSSTNATVSMARMLLNNSVTVLTGPSASYKISIGHFGFASNQEAVAYFQARDVDYIDFVVLDENTVFMNFDLNNAAVSTWTLADWKVALAARADLFTPRTLPSN